MSSKKVETGKLSIGLSRRMVVKSIGAVLTTITLNRALITPVQADGIQSTVEFTNRGEHEYSATEPIDTTVQTAPPLVAELKIPSTLQVTFRTFHNEPGLALEPIILLGLARGVSFVRTIDIARMLRGEQAVPNTLLEVLTFDDGYYAQNFAGLILKRYGQVGTFYPMGRLWQGDGVHYYLRESQIQKLHLDGNEIGCHTFRHPNNLIAYRARDLKAYNWDLFDAKADLEDLIQASVLTFAYPYGVFDSTIEKDLQRGGYLAAVSTIGGNVHSLGTIYHLYRNSVN